MDPCVFNYNLQGKDEDNGRMRRNILIRRSLICSVAAAVVDIGIHIKYTGNWASS